MKKSSLVAALLALLGLGLAGCVHVPTEVVQLHAKEKEIVTELQRTHLALIDGYVDQRLAAFEKFYFGTYGPRYVANWKSTLKEKSGRDYDEAKDFPVLHEDLVAEYLKKSAPIEQTRAELKAAVRESYAQLAQSQAAVQAWLLSAKKLSDTERALTNKLLAQVNPALSLEAIDRKIADAQAALAAN